MLLRDSPKELVAPDVLIRPCSVDDGPAMHAAVRESALELMRWMPWCHADYSVQEARSWLKAQVQAFNERNTITKTD